MERHGQRLIANWRIAVLGLLFGTGLLFLGCSLHRVQVEESQFFSKDQRRQSIRRVQIPGARGRIFDRNGICLADNRPNFCIAYYVEELRKRGNWTNTINAVDQDIDRLAARLKRPRMISRKEIADHVMRSLPMPLLAWTDVDQETLARWAEVREPFPGTEIYEREKRHYPHGSLACHLLGYVRWDRPKPLPGQKVHFYLPEMIGRAGLEARYNDWLTGTSGEQLCLVDSRGYKVREKNGKKVSAGKDLHLTLDIRIQRALEKALTGWKGAGVVVDPRNGEVLALASAPDYDLNDFVPYLSAATWRKLNKDPRRPLLNRAVQGRYAPGSTFKPVTAIAALQGGYSPAEEYDCKGVYILGRMRLHCWDTYGHGPIAMRRAIEQSCNCYFSNLGVTIGYEKIYAEAHRLGLGRETGIDLPHEAGGLLPTAEWKRRRFRDDWRPGDTSHISIGQGFLLTTPLQMAMLVSVYANGGTLYRPRLNRALPVEKVREMHWKPEAVELVRRGMHDVASVGTGRRVRVRGLEVAAKTGTAEVDAGHRRRRKNTWVTAFAPFDHPTVAMAIMVEDGSSGGGTVAPMVRDVLVSIFGEAPTEEPKPAVQEVVEPEPAIEESASPEDRRAEDDISPVVPEELEEVLDE